MAKARYKTKQMTELHTFLQSVQGQHVTVQEIREYFKDREIAVGTTTIYRQLEKMVKEGLKKKNGYCPCRLEMNEDTKCMCKEFREQIADENFEGYCHCMLYYKEK